MKNITSLSADARYLTGISAMQRLWRAVVRDGRKRRRSSDALWIDINSRNNCWDNPWLYTWAIREKMIKEGEE